MTTTTPGQLGYGATRYGVMTMYDDSAEAGYSIITVWSGPFASTFEARGIELDTRKGEGYMLTTYNDDTVWVSCPSPRDDDNYQQVDAAIGRALTAHHHPLPALPFPEGDSANIGCTSDHTEADKADNPLQHTLSIQRDDEEPESSEDRVFLTIVAHGLPTGDISVDRRELLTALGVAL